MNQYQIKIDPEALADIQEITDWYNEQQPGLGGKFQKTTIQHINSLRKDPQIYAVRYKEIRCIIVKKFPFMIHFHLNQERNTVSVLAVISTHRNPKIWEEKSKKY